MSISLEQAYQICLSLIVQLIVSKKLSRITRIRFHTSFKFLEGDRGCPISEIMLDSVTTMDLKKYVAFLRSRNKPESHPLKPTVNQPITKRSIRTYSVDLRTFFHFLYYEEYIPTDITKGFKITKSETKLVLPLFDGEVQKIDSCFNQKTYTGLRNYCIVHFNVR